MCCAESLLHNPSGPHPVMLLTSGPSEPRYAAIATQVRIEVPSLILLDRPVRKELLLSAVQVAYTSRLKQLQVRDAAARQTQNEEALRNSEKLAVAGRLAATMAHEVSNPLEAMGNLLYLVENCTSLEDAQTFGRMATQELKRISEIIDRTLRFHRSPPRPESPICPPWPLPPSPCSAAKSSSAGSPRPS